MPATPSTPEIAEGLFARAPETTDEAIDALSDAYRRLAAVISAVVGDAGFRAIFARSLQKAKAQQRSLAEVTLTDGTAFIEPLVVRLREEDPATIKAASVALLAHFIDLLSTLIGSDLTLKLLLRAWPRA